MYSITSIIRVKHRAKTRECLPRIDSYYDNVVVNVVPGAPFFAVDEGSPHVVLPPVFENVTLAHTHGAETLGTWTVTSHWKRSPSVSGIHLATSNGDGGTSISETLDSTPRLRTQLRTLVDLTRQIAGDVAAWHVGHSRDGGDGAVPAYHWLDTRLGWRIGEPVGFSVVGQDLLRPLHAEFYSEDAVARALVERSAFGRVTWKF